VDDDDVDAFSLTSDESVSTCSSSAEDDRTAALSALSALADSFNTHQREFVSPSSLLFQRSPSPSSASSSTASDDGRSPSPPLAFTSLNAPLLAYEDFLVRLLSQIDAVESHGDEDVRRARKELVRRVEGELRRLDETKEREWERQSSASGSESSSASEVEEEEDVEMSSSDEDEEDEQGAFWSSLPCFSS
jgi:hypothetical protein